MEVEDMPEEEGMEGVVDGVKEGVVERDCLEFKKDDSDDNFA